MAVDQRVVAVDPLDRLAAVLDRSLTVPTKGSKLAGRWSDATASAYVKEMKSARQWWEADRRSARAGSPVTVPDSAPAFMPWSPERLARYVAHLAQQGRAPGTIRKAMAAVKAFHRLYGLTVPDVIPALEVLQDHDHSLRESGWTEKRAVPATVDTVIRLLTPLDRWTVSGRRDAAVVMLTFAGMLPTAMLSALRMGDVAERPDGVLIARQDSARPFLVAHWHVDGAHHPQVCPVEAILEWHSYMESRNAPAGSPLIRPVSMSQAVAGIDAFSGPTTDDGHMTVQRLSDLLARLVDDAGFPDDQRPTLTDLRLGGIVRRRLDGATVDDLAAASGLSTVRSTLLEYVAAAERDPR
jgi:hypothetical protein